MSITVNQEVEKKTNKRILMSDNSFMNDLNSVVKKKPKIVRKKKDVTMVDYRPSQNSNIEPPQISSELENKKKNSKGHVRFADAENLPLVKIKYFEVIEGERVNVSTITDAEKEGLVWKQHITDVDEDMELDLPVTKNDSHAKKELKYRLIKLENIAFIDIVPGSESIAKIEEERRSDNIMAAFYGTRPLENTTEPDPENLIFDSTHAPKAIPLESQDDEPSNAFSPTSVMGNQLERMAINEKWRSSFVPSLLNESSAKNGDGIGQSSSNVKPSHDVVIIDDDDEENVFADKGTKHCAVGLANSNVELPIELKNFIAKLNVNKRDGTKSLAQNVTAQQPTLSIGELADLLEKVRRHESHPSYQFNNTLDSGSSQSPGILDNESSFNHSQSGEERGRRRFDSSSDGKYLPPLPNVSLPPPNVVQENSETLLDLARRLPLNGISLQKLA
uniref:Uncharacterized protein n=1 Tax=Acrobeloides nanus TaxID=290746 RepID=A0A914D488_9BILA